MKFFFFFLKNTANEKHSLVKIWISVRTLKSPRHLSPHSLHYPHCPGQWGGSSALCRYSREHWTPSPTSSRAGPVESPQERQAPVSPPPQLCGAEALFRQEQLRNLRLPSFTKLPFIGQKLFLRHSKVRRLGPEHSQLRSLAPAHWERWAKKMKRYCCSPVLCSIKQGVTLGEMDCCPCQRSRAVVQRFFSSTEADLRTESSVALLKGTDLFETELGEVQA